MPSFPRRVALICSVNTRACARLLPGSAAALSRPTSALLGAGVTFAIVVASLVLPGRTALAAPEVSQYDAHERAAAVVLGAGFEPENVPELVDVSQQIEAWILDIENLADRQLAMVDALDRRLRANELETMTLQIRLEFAKQAVEGADLTREIVQLRDDIPALEQDWAEAQRDLRVLNRQADSARREHAQGIEALMVAWNLRHEVGTSFANFASEPVTSASDEGWTPLLRLWAMDLFREAKVAVASLEAAPSKTAATATASAIKDTATASKVMATDELPVRWPAIGAVNSGYGMRVHPVWGGYRMHTGVDIDANRGDDVVSIADGVVIRAGWNGGYGNTVEVDHGDGLTSLYAHLASFAVALGDEVTMGETVGLVGATGTVTDAHLHFETRLNSESVDPLLYLP